MNKDDLIQKIITFCSQVLVEEKKVRRVLIFLILVAVFIVLVVWIKMNMYYYYYYQGVPFRVNRLTHKVSIFFPPAGQWLTFEKKDLEKLAEEQAKREKGLDKKLSAFFAAQIKQKAKKETATKQKVNKKNKSGSRTPTEIRKDYPELNLLSDKYSEEFKRLIGPPLVGAKSTNESKK